LSEGGSSTGFGELAQKERQRADQANKFVNRDLEEKTNEL